MATAYKTIAVEKRPGGLDICTLNRPERLNALSFTMIRELTQYFASLRDDYDTRVVILRGAGRGFCAGLDLQEESDLTPQPGAPKPAQEDNEVSRTLKGQRQLVNIFRTMRAAPQPVIALIHGAATGAGFGLALAADVRLVTPQAKMNVAMYKMGTTGGDMGISYALPRLVGLSVASELMFTGRFIMGERAVSTKLASEMFPNQEAMEAAAQKLAAEMLEGEVNGLRLTKECIQLSVDAPSFENAVAMEDRQQILMGIAGDWKSRIAKFSAAAKKSKL